MPTDADEVAAREEWNEMSFDDGPNAPESAPTDDAAELMRATTGMSDSEFHLLGHLITGIRHMVLALSITIWAIVGFIFWIPMLVFSIIHFSALIVYATLTAADPSTLASKLEHSVRFYLEGFRNIIQAVYRTEGTPTATIELHIDGAKLAKHVASTFAFWFVIVVLLLLSMGVIQSWFPAAPNSGAL